MYKCDQFCLDVLETQFIPPRVNKRNHLDGWRYLTPRTWHHSLRELPYLRSFELLEFARCMALLATNSSQRIAWAIEACKYNGHVSTQVQHHGLRMLVFFSSFFCAFPPACQTAQPAQPAPGG